MGGGGGGWWVAWSNLVSAQGPLVLGLGLKGLGPGLDNIANILQYILCIMKRILFQKKLKLALKMGLFFFFPNDR